MGVAIAQVLDHIAAAIRRGDFAGATALFRALEERLTPQQQAVLTPFLAGLKSDLMSRQGEADLAREHNARAFAENLVGSPIRVIALSQEATLELKAGNLGEAERLYREALALAEGDDLQLARANITSDLGLIAHLRGADDAARTLTLEARRLYVELDEEGKAADCTHVLGAMARNDGDADAAIALTQEALAQALESDDLHAVERRAGDLARAYLARGHDDSYEHASTAINMALVAADKLWERASSAPSSVGARVERAVELFNNLETSVLVESLGPEPMNAYVHVCRAKGRILRDDVGERDAQQIEAYRARDRRFAPLAYDALATSALPLLLADVASAPVALVDHFAMSAGDLFCVAHVAARGELPDLVFGRVRWPGPPAPPLASRALRGDGQGAEGRRTAIDLMAAMEAYVDRAPYLLTETGSADDEARATMKADADALTEALSQLGQWLFPPELRRTMEERGVAHVFLAPDPRLFSLPWQALILDDGSAIIDQPWTLSVLPSALSLYELPRRRRRSRTGQPVIAFAPDHDVNERLGGREEILALAAIHPTTEILFEEAATLDRIESVLRGGAWVHLRTHGTRGSQGAHVPKLFDGAWERCVRSDASGVLVAMCCRVGEVRSRGYDVFGLIDIAEHSDVGTMVAPVISIDGIVGRIWSAAFYKSLRDGENVAVALRSASRQVRELYPHPSFWAPFVCFGDPSNGLRPISST